MKLKSLSAKPQLIEIELGDEDIILEFGEAISLHTWDRQSMETFMKLASADHTNTASVITIVKTLILDETGAEILTNEHMLPTHVLMKAIAKVTELLGK